MRKPIRVGAPGFIPDLPNMELPEGAWTDARNFRFREGAAERAKGYVEVFGSASVTPVWVAPVSDGLIEFWVYGNEGTLYATDGSAAHANVTSASFSIDPVLGYTGGAFHGFMIVNDAGTRPYSWAPSLSNKFQPLANWPASTTCDVIRSFGDFLIALRINESGTYNPRLIRWSDRAGAGALPGSWDFTDPTNQAGRTELGQTHDKLIDCLPIRDANIVYKQFHTWIMTYVGGLDVFQFREVFKQSGLLTENCAAAFGPRHFTVTDNDIIVHDGNDGQSIIDGRLRRWLFNKLSTDRFQTSFVVADYRERELWFCFPEQGYDFPNLGACWSWKDDSWYVRELGEQMIAGNSGIIEASGVTFDEDPGDFDTGPAGEFDEYDYTPWSQRLLLAPARPQLVQAGASYKWGSKSMSPIYAVRENMVLADDTSTIKRIDRIYPRVIGTTGDTVRFRVGARDTPEGPVSFQGPFQFVIGTDYKIDCRVDGRYVVLMIEYTGDNPVRLTGFDVEFRNSGAR